LSCDDLGETDAVSAGLTDLDVVHEPVGGGGGQDLGVSSSYPDGGGWS
jgi:hypothetical protein